MAGGRAVLDAVSDAANQWIFPELAESGLQPWSGVRWVAVNTPGGSHFVEVADGIDAAIASLAEHEQYLAALSPEPILEQARAQVHAVTGGAGASHPVVRFELYGSR
jgi:hypothetical protein